NWGLQQALWEIYNLFQRRSRRQTIPKSPQPQTRYHTTLQTGIEEQVAATAYFDLVLRSVTEPGLLKTLVKFLLDDNYDGTRLLDVLVQRLDSEDRLCLVSLALFESLIEINCEDIMLELIFKYLLKGDHLIVDSRFTHFLDDMNFHNVEKFLALSPNIMQSCSKLIDRDLNKSTYVRPETPPISKNMPTNWNHYGLYSSGTLYRNYHAYLCDAHQKLVTCQKACEVWSNRYDHSLKSTKHTTNNSDNTSSYSLFNEPIKTSFTSTPTSLISSDPALLDTVKEFLHEAASLNLIEDENAILEHLTSGNDNNNEDCSKKQLDSLQSLGDSSGYESFKYKPDDFLGAGGDDGHSKDVSCLSEEEKEVKANIMFSSGGDSDLVDANCIGEFLAILFSKLQAMPSNSVYVNIHLTGLLSRLSVFPQDLLRTLLLSTHTHTKAPIRTVYQIILSVREYIDTSLSVQVQDSVQIAEQAQSFLLERESRLVNARKNAIEAANKNRNQAANSTAILGGTNSFDTRYRAVESNNRTALAAQYSSTNYDPFKRNEPKRKSISTSLTQIFKRTNLNSASTGLSSIYEFFKGNSTTNNGNSGEPQSQINIADNITVQYSPATYWGIEANRSLMTNDNGANSSSSNDSLYNLVMSAVILDEWVKELAAILQEQTIEFLNKAT
ncbi:UPF0518 protein AAEL005291-like, partial [Ctenocephalides felis]|uniref:UPF0518 protein AAEL005291-like n=1 Tax=Ctenocephalides felis TaxID=7515 RepID=UPI000E6E2965